ncbi:hypothetical protein [Saliterribacillus persicus]|uniref:Uncharacterized protein n=1 Tax=Saliterribacillus persicus TaxID=930114 RepID=A0A368X6D2_9BACI|nr:hypothetical protein [Saliterribacillus persicus]RCW63385.1 hypothetical protein DFR57_11852 [Saliterribacillus persicus]
MIKITLLIIAGIYIFMNGMMKGILQVKIQILDNTGYFAGQELQSNRINFFARWVVFLLVFFFIGWLEVIILIAINLISFFMSIYITKNKYFDSETDNLKPEVFKQEIENNPLYQKR